MKCEQIDLYNYFGLKKPEGAKGILTSYIWSVSEEMGGNNRIRPAMLVIPGGGYGMVSDREGEPIALAYMNEGFNCFVLDYSVYPSIYPCQFREASMAMIYIRENADKYHVDAQHVSAIGFSAGGHLCGCLATMFNSEQVKDLRNSHLIRPSAVILSYPVFVYGNDSVCHRGSFDNLTNNDNDLSESLSLDKKVTKDSSPAFIWHTYEDNCVPVMGTAMLFSSYIKNGVPCELHVFEKGFHGLSLGTKETNFVFENVQPWLKMSVSWLKSKGFVINDNK